MITISDPYPTINSITIHASVMHHNVQFMPRKVFAYEPFYNALTAPPRVVITAYFKKEHSSIPLQSI
jgi:hypothetical protein